MLSVILIKKIFSLFLIAVFGVILLKMRILKKEDSRVLSVLTLYLFLPCVLLTSFQVEATTEIKRGVLLAMAAAIVVHILLLLLNVFLKRTLKLNAIEQTAVVYSNAGNLIIPLISAMLGDEWIIYTCSFICVQLILLWSHGKTVLCGEKSIDFKKILLNINLIVSVVGFLLFISGIRFPAPLYDAISSAGNMCVPATMLVTGVLVGSMDFKQLKNYKRIWLVSALRLLLVPLLTLLLLKYSGLAGLIPNGKEILLVTFLATTTPSASSLIQMTQVFGKDADYASAINVMTTLLCVVTMPIMVALYQL